MRILGGLNKKNLLLVGAAVAVVIVGVVAYKMGAKGATGEQQPEVKYVSVKKSGITYPSSWTEAKQITAIEKESGVTSIATKGNPKTRVIVRDVEGELAADFDIKKLPDQIAEQLEDEVDSFTLVSKGTTKYGTSDAVKIEYTQLNLDDQKVYEVSMFIVPTAEKTYYITYSTDEGASKISKDIAAINAAIAAYIKK
jgi:hypothetical protein